MERNLSILIADDKSEIAHDLVNELKRNSMEVNVCGKSGVEVFQWLENKTPDVIIMDAFLTHIDALGVLQRLKSLKLIKQPLIIIVSSIDKSRFEAEILKAGADYYFLKPIEPTLLAERIPQLYSWKFMGNNKQDVKNSSEANLEVLRAIST